MSFKRLDESLWSNNYALGSTLSTQQLIPTPPRSPTLRLDDSFTYESFSSLAMVDPNSILDETNHLTDPLDINLDPLLTNSVDIKLENCDTWWTNLCQHGFADSFCNTCSNDEDKNEVVNDFMWAHGAVQPDVSSTVMPQESIARTHNDSVSSKYSELMDPLSVVLANGYDTEELSPSHRLETPSESSDTDADLEEEHPVVENVYLDHNYHSINHRRRSDIRSPLRKALSRVSKVQTDSDDEIDVVNVSDPLVFNRVPNYHGMVNIIDSEESESFRATSSPIKRGRKPGGVSSSAPSSRKVGRPCKSKRLNTKTPKPISRRCGSRALQMDPQKRSLHNSMERMRRVDLKMCFDLLRSLIPSLKDRARAPKVLILQSALECVKTLQRTERKALIEIEKRKQWQRKLLVKLQRLKEEAAIAGKEFG